MGSIIGAGLKQLMHFLKEPKMTFLMWTFKKNALSFLGAQLNDFHILLIISMPLKIAPTILVLRVYYIFKKILGKNF